MIADEIERLELYLLDPEVRADVSEMERLLAANFVEFGSSGRTHSKADILATLPDLRDIERATISDWRCIEYRNTTHDSDFAQISQLK
jgi:hypothetical protein